MIRSLSVSNYRSLGENVTVKLGRFTALVGPNGSGKSNVIDSLRFVSDAMHMGLSGAITHRHGIDAVRRWSGGHPFNVAMKLELQLGPGRPAQESDGTLRVAGIVTALLQEPPVPLIGIEESDLTVHPGAIPLLFDFLQQATGRSQVIVTTHSPALLDLVNADDVRVVIRGHEGTTVAPMAVAQLARFASPA